MRRIVILTLVALAASAPAFALTFESDGASFEVDCLARGAVRVTVKAPGLESDMATYMTVPGALPESDCDGIEVRYSADPLGLAFYDREGQLLLRLADHGLTRDQDGPYQLRFHKEKGDRYFGLGELFAGNSYIFGATSLITDLWAPRLSLDQNGKQRLVTTRHMPPSELTSPNPCPRRGRARSGSGSERASEARAMSS